MVPSILATRPPSHASTALGVGSLGASWFHRGNRGPAHTVLGGALFYFFTLITNSFHSSAGTPGTGVKRTPLTKVPSPLAPSNLPEPPTTVAGASGKTVVVPSGFAVPSTLIQSVDSLEGVTLKY